MFCLSYAISMGTHKIVFQPFCPPLRCICNGPLTLNVILMYKVHSSSFASRHFAVRTFLKSILPGTLLRIGWLWCRADVAAAEKLRVLLLLVKQGANGLNLVGTTVAILWDLL